MGLIDDEHLVAVAHGREGSALAQLAGIVDTAVAGRIDLDHIQAAGAVTREVTAGIALAAGSLGRSLLTVQAPCEDPRGGGLPAAAGAQIGRAHVWNSSHVAISYAGCGLKQKRERTADA